MHLPPLIQDLAVILAVAGLMTLLFQKLKQPVVLGYLIAGFVVGPYTPLFQLVTDIPSIRTWAELGVIVLMFTLGLEFSFRKLSRVGGSAMITAGVELLFFMPVGYGVGQLFGWTVMDSIFLGAMLSVSSTTIVIKSLEELKLKTRQFAELIFAVLIAEDLIAIFLLVALTTVATTQSVSAMALLQAAVKLVLVVGSWIVTGYFILPRFMRYVGKNGSNEMITVLSLGLCLGLVVVATQFHYSAALGAFIMGSILAESSVLERIEARMESLRDLFGAIFFVSIGMLIDPSLLWEHRWAVFLLCLLTTFGKIFSIGLGSLISGQTFKNSVRVSFGLVQIGEFSFIIAALGMSLQVTSDFIYPLAVAVSLVTAFTTPYFMRMSGPLALKLENHLPSRIRQMLERYALWSEERRTAADRHQNFSPYILKWLVNGILVNLIFALAKEKIMPFLQRRDFFAVENLPVITWLAALAVAVPFIWGMISSTRHRGIIFLMMQFLTLIWIAALSADFFPARTVVMMALGFIALLAFFFYQKLEAYYRWFEVRFLSTFQKAGNAEGSSQPKIHALAPWDEHLVKLKAHPNAAFIGKKLSELQLRNRYGVNVVAINRGDQEIVAPRPDELIYPFDELLVLSSDEHLEGVRDFIEASQGLMADEGRHSQSYELKHILVKESGVIREGMSIRNSGIRERYSAMVVGIERDYRRLMNPDSDLKLLKGDVLWIVGPVESLSRLMSADSSPVID